MFLIALAVAAPLSAQEKPALAPPTDHRADPSRGRLPRSDGDVVEECVGSRTSPGRTRSYNNTCAAIYYSRMQQGDVFQTHSRIPSTTGRRHERLLRSAQEERGSGCRDAYTVNGFEIAYCSSSTSTVDWRYDFAAATSDAAVSDMIPQYTVLVTDSRAGRRGARSVAGS